MADGTRSIRDGWKHSPDRWSACIPQYPQWYIHIRRYHQTPYLMMRYIEGHLLETLELDSFEETERKIDEWMMLGLDEMALEWIHRVEAARMARLL